MKPENVVNVTFKVEVNKSRFGSYGEGGEAELNFDIPSDMLMDVDYSELLQSLASVAFKRFMEKQEEEE